MKTPTLILFDIDGTILTSGGAGETALRTGFQEEFGLEENLTTIEISGRTDSGIARQVLAKHNLPATVENLTRFYEAYLRHLERLLPSRQGRLLPGVRELLESLRQQPDTFLGLLTGNLRDGARLKLQHYGVADFFECGAFADDHHDRNQLGSLALARAHETHGIRFAAENTFVIGDTPHDIGCARACGARAVAVATGSFTREGLAPFEPDALFEDLSNLPAVLSALGRGVQAL
jgi:phosphoglycolate phosphatase-like HAD superfamily hydrolase